MKIIHAACLGVLLAAGSALSAHALPMDYSTSQEKRSEEKPKSLDELINTEPSGDMINADGPALDIREDAIKEAATSYGARGGLAWRTFQINKETQRRETALDKVYDFRQLLIAAPSGFLIEPPIITENINAMLIEGDGQQAAVSDRIYNIINTARIVSAPRNWRIYLQREWGKVEPPPDILLPKNAEEEKVWEKFVKRGWEEGIKQANEIFEEDLNLLTADFDGMVRYRMLLAQGMISAPYALQVDRGVTGNAEEMRIGDRAVQITGAPTLITGHDSWQPANR